MVTVDSLILRDEETGVTEYGRTLLANDARLAVERDYVIKGIENSQVTGTILDIWRRYDTDETAASLWVIHAGKTRLIHRKPSSRIGFTPFAKEHLLYENGYVRDIKHRTYIMGGKDADGKRIRREMRVTVLVAWMDYAAHTEYTHLWVKWKDGRRHLVHRKGL